MQLFATRFLALACGWLFCFSVWAFPEEFTATYTLTIGNITIGQATWSLASTGAGQYRYDAVTVPKGPLSLFYKSNRTEHSQWRYENGRIRPLLYRYNRGGKKDRKARVVFQWKAGVQGGGVAINTVNEDTWRMPVPDDVLDKNVYVLALMRDLARGRRDFEYRIADGGKIKTYRFSFLGEESLDTKLGPEKTLMVKRIRESVTRETTFWCAPMLHYLPVKVVHREKDGKVIVLKIDEFRLGRPE